MSREPPPPGLGVLPVAARATDWQEVHSLANHVTTNGWEVACFCVVAGQVQSITWEKGSRNLTWTRAR